MTDPMQSPSASGPRATCGARTRDGDPCRLPPVHGQERCRMHGGSSPQARAAAARRLAAQAAEADARALLAHEGLEGVTDPVAALARLATEADAFRSALARRVNALQSVRYEDAKGAEQLRAEVGLYERALDRTARFVEALARLGYEQRRVRIEEVVAAFRVATAGLQLDEPARLALVDAFYAALQTGADSGRAA